ncbi:acyltransferase family protein [Actinospongicola halichondriae]|uniref:acyltransferase family protein n=1 Tax=Actinospongicola halichondriae TaxID=3236844 RepID=UPI003D57CDB0
MPEPIKSGRRYMPGLDGLRAVAVLAVIVYHLGIDAVPGGLLGVSVFFTLSGYLITDLLLTQFGSGTFTLRSFWVARFRRLMPALFVLLVVVSAWVTVVGPHQSSQFRTAAGTAAFYVNNWWLVFREVSYFAQFDAPGPLNHLWSLSVEEQFYIVWPLLLLGAAGIVNERRPGLLRPRLGLGILALAAVSGVLMVALYEPGADPSRVYYGTDTRAAELLVGAALATVWPSQKLRAAVTEGARSTIDAVGGAGLLVIGAMFLLAEEFSPFLYRGGFVVLAVAVAATVASLAHPASRLAPIVGCAPMRWVGTRSYGIYLWHFPIIVLTTPSGAAGPGLVRGTLQVAATLGVAALSWRFVEDPIRHGALGRLWEQWKRGELRRMAGSSTRRSVAFGGLLAILLPALAGFAGVNVVDGAPGNEDLAVSETVTAEPSEDAAEAAPTTAGADPDALGPCTSVVHVGGSTSLGLVSSVYIPDEDQQISAQYARIGATTQHYEIAGGRAIIESYRENPAALDSAQKWRDAGYRGCWVFALGTMDAANVGIGAPTSLADRIDMMMEIADGDPVLWVNVKTIATTGSWRSEVMPPWNDALMAACPKYPNMRVYDWASGVQDDWFDTDGIHQNPVGYVARAERIADALGAAYPAGVVTDECLIEF